MLEAVYRFPLPGDAAVTAVRVRFGDVEIRAELKERQQAEADYDRAKRAGPAGRPGHPRVARRLHPPGRRHPARPGGHRRDVLRPARAAGGAGWSLRIPLTTAPRYVRATRPAHAPPQGQPLAPAARPRPPLRPRPGRCAAPRRSRAPPTRWTLTREGDRAAGPAARRRGPARPRLRPDLARRAGPRTGPRFTSCCTTTPAGGHVYFLALVAPPGGRATPGRGVPREVVLLVDHSGSMEGPKWQAADWAVERFLADLTERDAFALGLFHNTTRWLARGPAPGRRAGRRRGGRLPRGAPRQRRDRAGRGAGAGAGPEAGRAASASRHVLIVTDAQVSDAGRILRLADEESRRADRRRVSVLCIDAAPNSFLARELAERGGGVARFLTSDPEQEDIATALDEVLADWAEPVLAGLRLEVDRAGRPRPPGTRWPRASRRLSGIDLGDLPAGQAALGRRPRPARRGRGRSSFRLADRPGPRAGRVPAGAGRGGARGPGAEGALRRPPGPRPWST